MTKIGNSASIWTSFSELPRWIGWAGCKPVEPIEKNSQILIEYFLKNKEPKKNGVQF